MADPFFSSAGQLTIELADVRMIQLGDGTSFASETLAEFRGRDLDGDESVEAVSRALYTSPIPPAPTRARSSYGPSLAPAAKDIRFFTILLQQNPRVPIHQYRRIGRMAFRLAAIAEPLLSNAAKSGVIRPRGMASAIASVFNVAMMA